MFCLHDRAENDPASGGSSFGKRVTTRTLLRSKSGSFRRAATPSMLWRAGCWPATMDDGMAIRRRAARRSRLVQTLRSPLLQTAQRGIGENQPEQARGLGTPHGIWVTIWFLGATTGLTPQQRSRLRHRHLQLRREHRRHGHCLLGRQPLDEPASPCGPGVSQAVVQPVGTSLPKLD
jgi:hypothetical protein